VLDGQELCLAVFASLLVLCVSDVLLLLLLIATSSDMGAELSSALTPSILEDDIKVDLKERYEGVHTEYFTSENGPVA
jgi:hypothetical protein